MSPEELARARGDPVVTVLDWLIAGVRFIFRLGRLTAGADPAELEPPRARAAPTFEAYNDYVNRVLQKRVEEPSVTCPELLGEDDEEPREKVECEVIREPDGSILLQAKEGSRYHRKLIPPGSFNRRD